MTERVLECVDVWYAYRPKEFVLKGITLSVEAGKTYMIFGRSGVGKTTLLKVLKGIVRPIKGEVRYRGMSTSSEEVRKLAYRSIGYIPQGFGVVSNMTVLDNVLVGSLARVPTLHSILGQFPREEVERAKEVIRLVGLEEHTYSAVSQLSGGQRQRVAIARTLMQRPEVILADEFVSQLDPVTSSEVLEIFRNLAKGEKIAVVMTTHDTHLAYNYADVVLVMKNGRIALNTTADSIDVVDLISAMR